LLPSAPLPVSPSLPHRHALSFLFPLIPPFFLASSLILGSISRLLSDLFAYLLFGAAMGVGLVCFRSSPFHLPLVPLPLFFLAPSSPSLFVAISPSCPFIYSHFGGTLECGLGTLACALVSLPFHSSFIPSVDPSGPRSQRHSGCQCLYCCSCQ
jgi:hypothetical protein